MPRSPRKTAALLTRARFRNALTRFAARYIVSVDEKGKSCIFTFVSIAVGPNEKGEEK
jgi:hypothetical protein